MKNMSRIIALIIAVLVAFLAGAAVQKSVFSKAVISVNSTPPAELFIDGNSYGTTPTAITDLLEGTHTLRLERSGYETLRSSFVFSGESESIDQNLNPLALGSLDVSSTPSGASVYVDGMLKGKTPLVIQEIDAGDHSLELMKTNYFPKTVPISIVSGQPTTSKVTLEHRQISAYLQRINKNQFDISAYNDLGELYYVLGMYKEAADIYVKGYNAASSGHSWSSKDNYNLNKLKSEVRTKHKDKSFISLLDKAVMASVKTGNAGNYLIADFKKISWRNNREEYLAAIDGLISASKSKPHTLLLASSLLRQMGDRSRVRDLVISACAVNPKDVRIKISGVQELMHILRGKRDSEINDDLNKLFASLDTLKPGLYQQKEIFWEKSRQAFILGDYDQGFTLGEKAIATKAKHSAEPDWRVTLSEKYLSKNRFDEASIHLHKVKTTANKRSQGYKKAMRLMQRLPANLRKAPAKLPEKKAAPTEAAK